MARKNNTKIVVDTASPHTIKKFELIEEYVKTWAQKLLNYEKCNGIVFIDCMCNSGVYQDDAGQEIFGTPIRISKLLATAMQSYPSKQAYLCYNDFSSEKIEILKTHLPPDTDNFHVETHIGDGNDLLRQIAVGPLQKLKMNYLLVYDPYTASIDWEALAPFLNSWGEVILNHMVSDPIRGVSQAKSINTVAKYEETYRAKINELVALSSDREAFENKIREIISELQQNSNQRYLASFPFFNRNNVLVYNLIHCSGNIEGFKLFKKTTWKTFGGKSSAKNTHGLENQLMLDFSGSGVIETATDDYCYYISDIAKYLAKTFKGQGSVSFDDIYSVLDIHPVFPSEGFRTEIKQELKNHHGVVVGKKTMSFK